MVLVLHGAAEIDFARTFKEAKISSSTKVPGLAFNDPINLLLKDSEAGHFFLEIIASMCQFFVIFCKTQDPSFESILVLKTEYFNEGKVKVLFFSLADRLA